MDTNRSLASSKVLELAASYLEASLAPATRRAYTLDWSDWSAWCVEQGCEELPASPASVALYLSTLAGLGLAPSTLKRRLASISVRHRAAGLDSPCRSLQVRRVMQGIERTHGVAQVRARPVLAQDLRAMLEVLAGPWSLRDRAMLAVGWSCAMRESEIVSLRVEDLHQVDRGLEVYLAASKTDQRREGATIPVPWGSRTSSCPVLAWRSWLEQLEQLRPGGGPAFPALDPRGTRVVGVLLPRVVERLVRRCARRAGLGEGFSGHSLRAGYCTEAAAAGRPDRAIMLVSRHRSRATLDGYVRIGHRWDEVCSLL